MLVGVLFLVTIWGYSPLEAGLAMTPGAVVAAVVALRAGRRRTPRPKPVIIAGALMLATAGAAVRLTLPRAAGLPRLLAAGRRR